MRLRRVGDDGRGAPARDLADDALELRVPGGVLQLEWDGEGDVILTGPVDEVVSRDLARLDACQTTPPARVQASQTSSTRLSAQALHYAWTRRDVTRSSASTRD